MRPSSLMTDTPVAIAIKYTVFAALATAANIASQDFVIRFYKAPHGLAASILAGTAAGLVVKYELDRRHIFRTRIKSFAHNARLLSLYTMTGVATTLIFWATELAFELVWGTPTMRYLGATLGLSIGYLLKYQLDKRHVFRKS